MPIGSSPATYWSRVTASSPTARTLHPLRAEHIDYGMLLFDAEAFASVTDSRAFDLVQVLNRPHRDEAPRGLRGDRSPSTTSGRPETLPRDRTFPPGPSRRLTRTWIASMASSAATPTFTRIACAVEVVDHATRRLVGELVHRMSHTVHAVTAVVVHHDDPTLHEARPDPGGRVLGALVDVDIEVHELEAARLDCASALVGEGAARGSPRCPDPCSRRAPARAPRRCRRARHPRRWDPGLPP